MKKLFTSIVCLVAAILTGYAQNPTIGGYNTYYGHLHNHTGYSDGQETPDVAYAYARDKAKMDFFGLSDHAELLSKSEYRKTIESANSFNKDGEYVTFYGFEWTSGRVGHVSVFNTEDFTSSGLWIFSSFNSILKWMDKRECVGFFNHPGFPSLWKEFLHFEPDAVKTRKMVGIELWNGTGDFNKYYYNDGYYKNDGNKGYYDEALVRDWKIGASGSDDNHGTTWGTRTDYRMGILSKELTREALYEAMKEKRFFSTLDKNLAMSLKVNGAEMGSTIDRGAVDIEIALKDSDGESFTKVDLIKNGAVIKTWNINEKEPVLTLAESCVDGEYFYIRCKQADGDEAISSPVFVMGGSVFTPTFADVTEYELKSADVAEEVVVDEVVVENIDFTVYPNPATDEDVNIKIENLVEGLQLVVVDINGRILLNQEVTNNIVPLPVLQSGVYFVKVTSPNATQTKTLLVK